MDRGDWWATVHGVAKSRTQLSDFTFTSRADPETKIWVQVVCLRVGGGSDPSRALGIQTGKGRQLVLGEVMSRLGLGAAEAQTSWDLRGLDAHPPALGDVL